MQLGDSPSHARSLLPTRHGARGCRGRRRKKWVQWLTHAVFEFDFSAAAKRERKFKKKFLAAFGVFSAAVLLFIFVGIALVWGYDCKHCNHTKPRHFLLW